jgi:plastocyanin
MIMTQVAMTSLRLVTVGALLAMQVPVSAQAQAQGQGSLSAADVARLQADVARLERELREQKQLFMQQQQIDQQRYDMLLQLIRATPGAQAGGPANIPQPPAAPTPATPAPAPGAPAPTPAAGPPVATLSGQVSLPGGVDEAYVYVDGRMPTRPRAIEIKQQDKQFSPQVAVVPVGSKVSFPNTDAVFHNVFSRSPALTFDLGTVKSGEKPKAVTLPNPGEVEIYCNIHSKMRASILVTPNGHYTKVKPDGSFSLPGVPVGSRKVVVWGPSIKPASQVVEVRPGASISLSAEAAPQDTHKNKYNEAYKSY